ncbi:pentapeptide repeat-containing protein [Demequina sp. NBRC 110056]|uniref:pentapeptide repeat-containing protein n=1 Tax=Demequina sp. NBRC 110056 TaxID=1570345 RepID=UPI00135658E7|nr:pentapeptide repeat-containing protein [Demequina sp. NBRC 110056]
MAEPTTTRGVRGFIARNRDDLWLEVIGGVVLAFAVSGVMFGLDARRTDAQNAHSEALSNSLFVRQAVMAETSTLPFSGLLLDGAQLSGLPLDDADFADASLRGAELKRSSLVTASLAEADLTGADLTAADLTGADLTEATLAGVDLSDAVLTDADLTGTTFEGAWYDEERPPATDAGVLALLSSVPAAEADVDDD